MNSLINANHSQQQPSVSNDTFTQSYVPFLSKSPRFLSPQLKQPLIAPGILFADSQSQNLSKSKVKTKPAHYFRSEIPRLPQPSITETPSPSHYLIDQGSRSKNKQLPTPQLVKLPRVQTLPTIPDTRNKYGYLYFNKHLALASKTQEQLDLEKRLMREYQATLTEQKRFRKSSQKDNNCHAQSLQKKISKILGNQREQKQNQQPQGKSQSTSNLKPKYIHLYSYKQPQITKPPTKIQQQPIKQPCKVKFQFFNSSEQRFKFAAGGEGFSKQPGVRDYLLKLKHN